METTSSEVINYLISFNCRELSPSDLSLWEIIRSDSVYNSASRLTTTITLFSQNSIPP